LKEFIKRRGLIIIIVALFLSATTLVTLYATGSQSTFVTNTVNVVLEPVKGGIKGLVDTLEDLYGYMYEYDQLKAENDELRTQVTELEQTRKDMEELESQNNELREALNLDEQIRELEKVEATVTQWSSSNWSSTYTISKGEESGIAIGDPVISPGGELVGQVREVGSRWATVSSIVDPSISVGATAGNEGAIAAGDFVLMQQGCLKLTNVPSGAELVTGDTVYTSGAGEVIPPGLVIGTISRVEKEDSGLTSYAVIEPAYSLGQLGMVFVITDYNYS